MSTFFRFKKIAAAPLRDLYDAERRTTNLRFLSLSQRFHRISGLDQPA